MTDGIDNRRRYEGWVERWSADLFRFAYRLCGRRDLADDLVQETYFHAWRSIDGLRDESRARAWLFQILRHRWSHAVRTDLRRPKLNAPLDAALDAADDAHAAPLAVMAREESVRLALAELDERYRLPMLMVFVEGLTCREAADELGVPLGTVLSRIHRARKALRERLGEDDANDDDAMNRTPDGTSDESDRPRLRLGGAE